MEYAAIIIPTLNRRKHLERCINSLLKSRLAQLTDLYISVDFPPSEKYVIGYEDVKTYVKTIEGFSRIYLYFQEKNLGPGLNRSFLENKIADKHDKYVFTDDDNEFSENFLEYINWGLEAYKNDDSIYAICSKADFPLPQSDENFDYILACAYNPYGAGHWLHKNEKCRQYLVQENISRIYQSFLLQNKIYNSSPFVYQSLAFDIIRRSPAMRGKQDNITYIDIWENIYGAVNDIQCVIPIRCKSRNWGNDGSGVHSQNSDLMRGIPEDVLDDASGWKEPLRKGNSEYEKEAAKDRKKRFSQSYMARIKAKLLFLGAWVLNEKTVRSIYFRFSSKAKTQMREDVLYG